MKTRRACGLAVAVGAWVLLSCGGSTSGSGSACDQYFNVYLTFASCFGTPLPAAEASRIKPRFDQLCAAEKALPGSSLSDATIQACVDASSGLSCDSNTTPPACETMPGSRASGQSCMSDAQCASARCEIGATFVSDGGTTSSTCGTCATAIATGMPCGTGMGVCAPKSACDPTARTCQPVQSNAAGGACNFQTQVCNAGLVCNAMMKCAAPGGVGTSCSSSAGCTTGLVCNAGTCAQPVAVGAACSPTAPCSNQAVCDPTTMKCTPIGWASAGQPCSNVTGCLVGACELAPAASSGVCPAVVADGQPCPTDRSTTCDTFAQCIGGVCAIPSASTCN